MINIERAYDRACELAGKRYTRVTFEHDGLQYKVEPARLGRKVRELEEEIKVLRQELLDVMKWKNLEKTIPAITAFMGQPIEYWLQLEHEAAAKNKRPHDLPWSVCFSMADFWSDLAAQKKESEQNGTT